MSCAMSETDPWCSSVLPRWLKHFSHFKDQMVHMAQESTIIMGLWVKTFATWMTWITCIKTNRVTSWIFKSFTSTCRASVNSLRQDQLATTRPARPETRRRRATTRGRSATAERCSSPEKMSTDWQRPALKSRYTVTTKILWNEVNINLGELGFVAKKTGGCGEFWDGSTKLGDFATKRF